VVKTYPNVNTDQFSACMDKDMAAGIVNRDMAAAARLHVTGTPTFLVNGIRRGGAVTPEELHTLVQQALDVSKAVGTTATAPTTASPQKSSN